MTYFLILTGALLRLIPHIPNFAPIGAIALFGGVYLNKKQAILIPLIAMLAADIIIGFASFWVTFSVYFSFILISLIGLWLKNHKKIPNIIGASLSGSVLFFIITNFAVWSTTLWYSKTYQGLIQCYMMAVPFFKNTILGDLFYVGAMFGVYELVKYLSRRKVWGNLALKS